MNRKSLLQIEEAVSKAKRMRREGVRGQGRLDEILADALELIDSPLYRAAARGSKCQTSKTVSSNISKVSPQ
jgi:hypothetical protein